MYNNSYRFVTHWRIEGEIEELFEIISDPLDLPRWWPDVYLAVQALEPGDERGIGRLIDLHTKGWLPYTLRWQFRVTEVEAPYHLAIAALGDLAGHGIWTLTQDGPWTQIRYEWQVEATKPLLKYLSPLLRPAFRANHNWAMAKGEESLKRELARRQTAES